MEKQNNRLRPCSVFIGRRSGSADAARWIAIFAEVSSHRTILIRLSIFHNWLFLSETAQADSLCRVLSNYWSFWSRCGTSLFLDRINNTSSALSCVLESTFSVWGDVLYRLHLHSQVTASAHSVFRSFTLWHPGQSFWKILIKMWWEKKKKTSYKCFSTGDFLSHSTFGYQLLSNMAFLSVYLLTTTRNSDVMQAWKQRLISLHHNCFLTSLKRLNEMRSRHKCRAVSFVWLQH